jgi:hypothetical protein
MGGDFFSRQWHFREIIDKDVLTKWSVSIQQFGLFSLPMFVCLFFEFLNGDVDVA